MICNYLQNPTEEGQMLTHSKLITVRPVCTILHVFDSLLTATKAYRESNSTVLSEAQS